MIPIYILGILLRFGPQHGYQIQKTIADHLADFTRIKLPTIYYHLEAMARKGLLSANCESEGARPEKTVYTVTDKGREAFQNGLSKLLNFRYEPIFESDAVFYFGEYLPGGETLAALRAYVTSLKKALEAIEKHRLETEQWIPPEMRRYAGIIFDHHRRHYQAEWEWAKNALRELEEKKDDCTSD